jgi:hypothetical protein
VNVKVVPFQRLLDSFLVEFQLLLDLVETAGDREEHLEQRAQDYDNWDHDLESVVKRHD